MSLLQNAKKGRIILFCLLSLSRALGSATPKADHGPLNQDGYRGWREDIVYYPGQEGEWSKLDSDLCDPLNGLFKTEQEFNDAKICDCPCNDKYKEPNWHSTNDTTICRPSKDKYLGLCEVVVPVEANSNECKYFDYEANNCNYDETSYEWGHETGLHDHACEEYPSQWDSSCKAAIMTGEDYAVCYPSHGASTEEPANPIDATRYVRKRNPSVGFECTEEKVIGQSLVRDEKDIYFWNVTCTKYPGGTFPVSELDAPKDVPESISLDFVDGKYRPCDYYYAKYGPSGSSELAAFASTLAHDNKPTFCYEIDEENGEWQYFDVAVEDEVYGPACNVFPMSTFGLEPCRECEVSGSGLNQVGYCQVCKHTEADENWKCPDDFQVYVSSETSYSYETEPECVATLDAEKPGECNLTPANCDLEACCQTKKIDRKQISWMIFKDSVCLSEAPTPAPSPAPSTQPPSPAPVTLDPTTTRKPTEKDTCDCWLIPTLVKKATCEAKWQSIEQFKADNVCKCQCDESGKLQPPINICDQDYCEATAHCPGTFEALEIGYTRRALDDEDHDGEFHGVDNPAHDDEVDDDDSHETKGCLIRSGGEFNTHITKWIYKFKKSCSHYVIVEDYITEEDYNLYKEQFENWDDTEPYYDCNSNDYQEATSTDEKKMEYSENEKFCFEDMETIKDLKEAGVVYHSESWGEYTQEIIYPERFAKKKWRDNKDLEGWKHTWTKTTITLNDESKWYDIDQNGNRGFDTCYVFPTQDPETRMQEHCQTCVDKHVGFKVYDTKWEFNSLPSQAELYDAFARMSPGYGTSREYELFGDFQLRQISAYCMGCYWKELKMVELQKKQPYLSDYRAYKNSLKPENNECNLKRVIHKSLADECVNQSDHWSCHPHPELMDIDDRATAIASSGKNGVRLAGWDSANRSEEDCYKFTDEAAISRCADDDHRICAGKFCTDRTKPTPEYVFDAENVNNEYKPDWPTVLCNAGEFGDCTTAKTKVRKILRWKRVSTNYCTQFPDPTINPTSNPSPQPSPRPTSSQPTPEPSPKPTFSIPTVEPTTTPYIPHQHWECNAVVTLTEKFKENFNRHFYPLTLDLYSFEVAHGHTHWTISGPAGAVTGADVRLAEVSPCSGDELSEKMGRYCMLHTCEFHHCDDKMFEENPRKDWQTADEGICELKMQNYIKVHYPSCGVDTMEITGDQMCGECCDNERKLIHKNIAHTFDYTDSDQCNLYTCGELNMLALTQPAKFQVVRTLLERDNGEQVLDVCCEKCCKKKNQKCSSHAHVPACGTEPAARHAHKEHAHHDHWTMHHVLPVASFLGVIHMIRWFC